MNLPNAVRTPRFAKLAMTALLLAAANSTATAQQPTESDVRAQIEAKVDEAVAAGFVGQILAVHDGEILFQGGYGLADPESGAAVDERTVFPIGSVTKQFTRAAILKLEEEGALSTDDAIGTYLPDLPADKRDISIDHVMSMQAGFHEYHDDDGDHQPMTRDEAIARIGAQELLFEPGTQRAYSNSGFALLAAIVEVASGRSFNEYVREKLFEPAGLLSTGFHGELLWEDPIVARGHGAMRHGENQPHRWPAVTWALMGGGGIIAPAADLWRWIEAVRAGEVLGEAALAKFYPTPEAELVYAGGDDFGFTTVVVELAGGRDAVIVNNHSGNLRERIAIEIAESMHGAALVALRERMGIQETASTDNVEVGGPGGQIPDSPRAGGDGVRAGPHGWFGRCAAGDGRNPLRTRTARRVPYGDAPGTAPAAI